MSEILRFYRLVSKTMEHCYNIAISKMVSDEELRRLRWLLAETFEPHFFSDRPFLSGDAVEIGPRLNFATAWNTNALSILRSCGITNVVRIEKSTRYAMPQGFQRDLFIMIHSDRMTECEYPTPLASFDIDIKPRAVHEIKLIEKGAEALREFCKEFGVPMDEHDIKMYLDYFVGKLKRNPTVVELVDLGNANSEHSRHGYFRGRQVIDGVEKPETLMEIVKSTLEANQANSRLAFCDNSSVIDGRTVKTIRPGYFGAYGHPSYHIFDVTHDILFTAETHNFPSGVAPFPGAETGTGGRIRDVQATGRGGLYVAGTAGYCTGNLLIHDYEQAWENTEAYPHNLASPIAILLEASNGASRYGNEFGEPVIQGFVRTFGLRLPNGERREWLKPIMFTGGIGQIDSRHLHKEEARPGMLIIQIGGPAYRIGFGGGAASSMLQGENKAELDFNAVQRGDAEMEQKMNRVIRACIEMGDHNPIRSIHDQGAGGPANVLKELVEKSGGKVYIRRINTGDPTLSVLEIWVCEYQERNGILIRPEDLEKFKNLCDREKVPCEVLGEVTGDGKFTVIDEQDGSKPVELDLADVLGNIPQKTFSDKSVKPVLKPLAYGGDFDFPMALRRVLRLPSVCSKRFLTNKVDRSVTGLIARQQCVGPLQLPLADVAVIVQSHFPDNDGRFSGAAMAIGERPIIGLLDPAAQGRMTVTEMLLNIAAARITGLEHVKCSGNWMWAPKLPGEGAKLYETATAMRDLMVKLRIAIDGGKDSLSMAAKTKNADGGIETVKSPGQLVLSGYATVSDVTKVVTPDLKQPGASRLIHVDLSGGKRRLGGSALAQVFGQIGDECPDLEDPELLARAFQAVQELIDRGQILAYHDVSDGGLIITLLEMAFAGDCGFDLFEGASPAIFAEEPGFVFESPWEMEEVKQVFDKWEVPFEIIGMTTRRKIITLACSGETEGGMESFSEEMPVLRSIWEETSRRIDLVTRHSHVNPECVKREYENVEHRTGIRYALSFQPSVTPRKWFKSMPRVAIIREEGSNGDREMASAFFQAGFEPWDVTMTDLLEKRITLDWFRGVVFVGGFSYADVLDSAKGWAAGIRFTHLKEQFDRFYDRPDSFSLGVCNGCQLMALLGWAPFKGLEDAGTSLPRFIRNESGRFESRWSAVKILKSPAMMLEGMEGSVLGVWTAHGEGQAHFPDMFYLDEVLEEELAPVRYADDGGFVTEQYPFNPNGSIRGIAGLCSEDGRHLAMMPHPERAFLKWQWPYRTPDIDALEVSPWMKMFQNARKWSENNK